MSTPKGTILLAHPVLAPIGEQVMLDALRDDRRSLPYRGTRVRCLDTTLGEIEVFDWWHARTLQDEWYRSEFRALVADHPDYVISYFGAAPIPLAFHLGYLVGGFGPTEVYLQNHETKEWHWAKSASGCARWRLSQLPDRECYATGDVVIRVSTSHHIDSDDTRSVIARALVEIDIGIDAPNEDALTPDDVEEAGRLFSKALDSVARYMPNADRVHVFAAVPVGVAFALGACVNPTIHHAVQTYQFIRTATPRYQAALVLQGDPTPVPLLSPDEIRAAHEAREQIARCVADLQSFGARVGGSVTSRQAWWAGLVSASEPPFCGRMARLPGLYDTVLMRCGVDHETTDVPDGFRLDPRRGWQFSDEFLTRMLRRFEGTERFVPACRMLLLHEGLHAESHRLTDATAPRIRRLPKVVEELDYEADIWALLHEMRLSEEEPTLPELRDLVDIALETFWSFDDRGRNLDRIEIRRLNRYLIWYWQGLALDRCGSIDEALAVLAEKPVIEVAGPKIQSAGDRVFYLLDQPRYDSPEIGGYGRDGLFRFGDGPASRVVELLDGFRYRNGAQIKSALKSVADQVKP